MSETIEMKPQPPKETRCMSRCGQTCCFDCFSSYDEFLAVMPAPSVKHEPAFIGKKWYWQQEGGDDE